MLAETLESAAATEARYTLPVYDHLAIEPVAGDGPWLLLADGRRVLDFYGGHAVALLGYGHQGLTAAIAGQASELVFQSNVVPLAVRARAAERLARFGPVGLERVFFVSSGAEANENALRLAFRKTGRERVVALEGAFHGRTAGAAAVTWGAGKWYGFPRPPFDVTFVPRGDLAALEAALVGAAALILEPVQGVGGAVDLGADYLRAARALTTTAGAALIFDEVQCGMGRSGSPFVAQAVGVTPDLLTTAKGLAGGLPAGAVLTSEAFAAGLRIGDLGTTFGGGPVVCAAIAAVIDALEAPGFLARVERLSGELRTRCLVGPVTAVQGRGLLLGLRTTRPAKTIVSELLARGIVTGGSADPHVVRLLPPLNLPDEAVDLLVQALSEITP
ncbi:MAG: aminotransferase class III-fold pyridoxal phosphate-dependent enzyme [Thermoanaerobaculia bacterium]|nr:aminotransferase class III-fold pyridoxal phosphate-dependent enzyme [Thermoanaerobaculia bacterium]